MDKVLDMDKTSGTGADKKLILVVILVFLTLGGSFALIYANLKADLTSLKNNNANLSSQIEQLQGLIEELHANQTSGLAPVQIYNRTKNSVVLIMNDRGDGSTVEGSGFVYDLQGYIITNNHVVDDTVNLTVTFLDGTTESAQIIGSDVYSDLAVIKIGNLPAQSPPLILGNSSQLMVGEPVYAIGNPFGLSSSMTSGIVSQLGRVLRLSELGAPAPWGNYSIADLIQFDAAVNPGNSGGPLLNNLGFVVGITFAIETGESGLTGFIGIGYAVPSVLVMRVASALISIGHYYHPYVGIEYDSRYTGGVLIVSVVHGGPAETVGLQANDIIKEVDGHQINRGAELIIYLERYKSPGDTVLLKVSRGNTNLNVTLTLGQRPV
jgi:S1-C subfamily serine protease